MAPPNAAMLVIGDEILSGRTLDTNTQFLAAELVKSGITLTEMRVVADDENAIITAVRTLAGRYDYVFTSGGIGPTHDDITADAIAKAFGVGIDIREDARSLLAAFYKARGTEFNAARQRMARIPDGAALIPNPVSVAPGFRLENVHVLAGVPQVFQAMVASIVPGLIGGEIMLSDSMEINRPEGDIAAALGIVAALFPDLGFGSYPFSHGNVFGANVVIRGYDRDMIDTAKTHLATLRDPAQPCPEPPMTHHLPPLPDAAKLMEVCEATWPPASTAKHGAWTIREGQGGGNRVSAATENWPTTEADLATAEKAMAALGQDYLFQVRDGQQALDVMLGHLGYQVTDPVNIYAISIEEMLRRKAPMVSGFQIWPPMEIMRELWHDAGIGAARQAVMERSPAPKTALFGRSDDQPAGVAFVAIHDDIAMLHALEVVPALRRLGTAQNILATAAEWAADQGAKVFSLVVTQGNHAANPLYAALGMRLVGHYHYRKKTNPDADK